jgi:hypothetical protein
MMNHMHKRARSTRSQVLGALATLLCSPSHHPARAQNPEPQELWKLYHVAVEDAAVVEPDEIFPLRPLFDPPAPDAAPAAMPTTTVVTWTNWDGYKPGQSNTLGTDVWIVALSEMQEALRAFPPKLSQPACELRLSQLLGLPPNTRKSRFVVMSIPRALADTSDVFRPTADPDVAKPWPGAGPSDIDGVTAFPPRVPPPHVGWIASQMLASYKASRVLPPGKTLGYPWTRLGYTYNWRPGASERGLSEYVLRRGATVQVSTVHSSADFFQAHTPR